MAASVRFHGGTRTSTLTAVRHATEADLDRLEPLLARLRTIEGITERKRGLFQRRSKAFLHFHGDGDDLYADVRFTDDFVRQEVTTPADQAALADAVEAHLSRPG
jgi:hypothetical protein